ncbi:hypothetical protein AUC69_00490 [Methyloceanibacter superfactus]|jgi:Protein of unknown function (DUF1761)|uniref:DUF1761 domain-containing protein n=1 Tax=Methyloceanibacter superfactus TaxID=1774969 RepID=A0A1E3WA80_9HYPH|nr:DUF1761 domain-containing protein [Methyloceanibacter superfactus]ODS02007.1 hypothetical protein AUC69_00490 [Methyloceanibacter superfactus]
MTFSGVNYAAVVIAALAGFGLGAVWYMVLGGVWLRAIGKTRGELDQGAGAAKALPFVIALVALLVMASMLAGIMGHLGSVTVRGGLITGFFCWLGFVITTMGVNHAFGHAKPMLTLIDGGHWLAVLLIQGAVIGAFGV